MVPRRMIVLGILLALLGSRGAVAEDSPPRPVSGASPAQQTAKAALAPRPPIVFRVDGLACPVVSGLG